MRKTQSNTQSNTDRNPGQLIALQLLRRLPWLVLPLIISIGLQTAFSIEAKATTPPGRVVEVGVTVSPPFVMDEGGDYSGMAIELWENIAESLSLQSTYKSYPTPQKLVDAAASDEIDVAVTNLTITRDREERLDFTQPWFDGGLRLMVPADQSVSLRSMFAGLMDTGHLRAYGWLVVMVLGATLLVTLFNRKFDPDFPRRWREGIAESFYTVMSVASSGRTGPSRQKELSGWLGRIWAAVWLMCGIAVLSYITASVTSVMTTLSLNNQIRSLEDLPGRTIGVFSGSTAEEFARRKSLSFRAFPTIDSAVMALLSRDIAAVVGDAPVIEYYQHRNSGAAIEVVGPIFEAEKYGFALSPDNDNLSEAVTLELLEAKESGLVEKIRENYFGNNQ